MYDGVMWRCLHNYIKISLSIQMNNFKILKLVSNIIYSHDVYIYHIHIFPPPPKTQIMAPPLYIVNNSDIVYA